MVSVGWGYVRLPATHPLLWFTSTIRHAYVTGVYRGNLRSMWEVFTVEWLEDRTGAYPVTYEIRVSLYPHRRSQLQEIRTTELLNKKKKWV